MLSRKEMALIIIITLISVFFFALLPPCASLQIQLQPSLQHQVNAHQHLSLPTLPRKIRLTEQVAEYNEARDLESHKQKVYLSLSGKQHHRKQHMMLGNRETRQEWVAGDDPSQYFSMDYTRVRRRRPIHNKNLPVGPYNMVGRRKII